MARWYWDKRDTVEDARVLPVGGFHRRGYLQAGQWGTSRWLRGEQETGSICWYCDGAALWLEYAVTPRDGEKRPYYYAVRLVRSPQPFGGERIWFVCPRCEHTVAKLYMAPGSHYFWCRACQGLSYRSRQERIAPYWKLWARAHELERTLDQLPTGRHKWFRTLGELDAVNRALHAATPQMLADLDARQARLMPPATRMPRRPGRPSKRALRERARLARRAARPTPPDCPPGRPKVKRAYTRRQPWALATPPAAGLAYCVRCRDRRRLVRARAVTFSNGRPALRGRARRAARRLRGSCRGAPRRVRDSRPLRPVLQRRKKARRRNLMARRNLMDAGHPIQAGVPHARGRRRR
jgi:hypothetical protein